LISWLNTLGLFLGEVSEQSVNYAYRLTCAIMLLKMGDELNGWSSRLVWCSNFYSRYRNHPARITEQTETASIASLGRRCAKYRLATGFPKATPPWERRMASVAGAITQSKSTNMTVPAYLEMHPHTLWTAGWEYFGGGFYHEISDCSSIIGHSGGRLADWNKPAIYLAQNEPLC
jgi:hypothetical protein